MKLIFRLLIAGERIEGGIILRKCALPPNEDATLGELADKQIVDTVGENRPSAPPQEAA